MVTFEIESRKNRISGMGRKRGRNFSDRFLTRSHFYEIFAESIKIRMKKLGKLSNKAKIN